MKKAGKNRDGKRRILAAILAILLALAMIVGMAAPFFGAEATDSPAGNIKISGELGFANRYKVGGTTPIKIHLTNSGDAFKGFLQVKVNVSNDKRYKRNYVYSYPVELPQGSSKRIELEAQIQTVKSYQQVVLVDEKGNQVASKLLYCSAIDPNNVVIGAFSDEKNSLNYLRQLKVNLHGTSPYNMTLGDKLIFFDEDSFPASEASLKSFNMVVINNYDTSRIKSKDMDTLVGWVKSGGILIIGTGANFEKTFRGIDDRLVTAEETGSKTELLSKLIETSEDTGGSNARTDTQPGETEEIFLSELIINGKPQSGGDTVFSTTIGMGSGAVIVHSFDLGVEPAPGSAVVSDYLTSEYLKQLEPRFSYNQNDYMYDSSYHLLQNLPSLNNISILLMFVIIFVYILVIGPILYFVLKKKDMRERGFVIIPVLAIITLGCLYSLGVNAMYKKPIVNAISKIKAVNGEVFGNAETNYGVFSPRGGTVRINLNQDASPAITSQDYFYPYGNYGASYEKDVAEIQYMESPEVLFFEKASWDANTIKMNKTVDFKGGMQCDFTLSDGMLKGTVENNTGLDLEDVVVGIGFDIEKYDGLKNGEKLEIAQKIDLSNQNNSYYEKISKFYQDALGPKSQLSFEEKRKAYYKQSLLQDALSRAYDMPMKTAYFYSPQPYASSSSVAVSRGWTPSFSGQGIPGQSTDIIVNLYAFNFDVLDGEIISVNGIEPNQFHTNFFTLDTKFDYTKADSFELPYGLIGVSRINAESNFDMGGVNDIYLREPGNVEFVFNISKDVKFGLFQIKWDALVKKEIFNVKTDAWEELSNEEYTESAGDYINESGDITLRGGEFKEGALTLPAIRIKSK